MGKHTPVVFDSKGKRISKENAQEYRHEKRMKELGKRGYSTFNIRYQMGYKSFSERQIAKAMKNENIKTDGNL